jgi:hypothetical protein
MMRGTPGLANQSRPTIPAFYAAIRNHFVRTVLGFVAVLRRVGRADRLESRQAQRYVGRQRKSGRRRELGPHAARRRRREGAFFGGTPKRIPTMMPFDFGVLEVVPSSR